MMVDFTTRIMLVTCLLQHYECLLFDLSEYTFSQFTPSYVALRHLLPAGVVVDVSALKAVK